MVKAKLCAKADRDLRLCHRDTLACYTGILKKGKTLMFSEGSIVALGHAMFVINPCPDAYGMLIERNLPTAGNAMLDYRSIGHLLRQRWLRRQRELQQALSATVAGLRQRPEHDFIRALIQHARGNSKFLIDYLRSDRPLLALDREHFAQILEGALDRKKRRGRPLNRGARTAAMQARVFYRMWQDENKKAGIKDYGHRDAMRDEAARFVLHELEPHSPAPDFDVVRDFMDRSQSRRDL